MLYKTHILFGVTILETVLLFDIIDLDFINGINSSLFLLGCLLPDIDNPKSFLGHRIRIISLTVNKIFGHRGFTHWLIFPMLIYVVTFFSYNRYHVEILFLCFGVITHQVGDMMTNTGIDNYFFPFIFFKLRYKTVILPEKLRFKTGSNIEIFFVFPLFMLLSILMFLFIFYF